MRSRLVTSQHVTEPAPRLDDARTQASPEPADKLFDGIGIPLAILTVQVIGKFGLGQDLAPAMQQLGQQPEFERCQLDRHPILAHLHLACVEHVATEWNAR